MSPSTVARSSRSSPDANAIARHQAVLIELAWGVVEDHHAGAGRRQDRPLLSAAGCQAQDAGPVEFTEPIARDRAGGREHDLPFAAAGGGDRLGRGRDGPLVPRIDLTIPGLAVVVANGKSHVGLILSARPASGIGERRARGASDDRPVIRPRPAIRRAPVRLVAHTIDVK